MTSPKGANRSDRLCRGMRLPMSGLGLGRVKTFCRKRSELCDVAMRAVFSDFDYARIAAISGWMPMMFITRVRL
jgi:hypothetical protein